MDRRRILQDVLAGRLTPNSIPGRGCITITPTANGLVDVDGRQMDKREANKAIKKAETVIFFEGEDDGNDLFNELSADPSFVIDFNGADDDDILEQG
jgi:hypothetical protein